MTLLIAEKITKTSYDSDDIVISTQTMPKNLNGNEGHTSISEHVSGFDRFRHKFASEASASDDGTPNHRLIF